jgi:hypothetical protein
MSTLVGTSRAVVVGAGPTVLSPNPPQAAVPCWTNPAYFEDWGRGTGGATNDMGCTSPTGYPWISIFGNESNPGPFNDPNCSLLTINNSFDFSLLNISPTVCAGDNVTASVDAPFDCISSAFSFTLQQLLAVTTDVDNIVWLKVTVRRLDVTSAVVDDSLEFDIYSESRQTHTPLGEYMDLSIVNRKFGSLVARNDFETSGLNLLSPASVSFTITPTSALLSAAGSAITLPWYPTAYDYTQIVTKITLDAELSTGEGPFNPTTSPNSSFREVIGPIAISTPYGNCMVVNRC